VSVKQEETFLENHIRVLAVLQIAYASVGLLIALGLLMILGGAATIVGVSAPAADSVVAIPILAFIATVAAGFLTLLSLPRLIAGIGLLRHRNWGRILTMVVSVVGLLDIPVGTALGIYGLWVLTTRESATIFQAPADAVGSRL
jgi:hypothetical protein